MATVGQFESTRRTPSVLPPSVGVAHSVWRRVGGQPENSGVSVDVWLPGRSEQGQHDIQGHGRLELDGWRRAGEAVVAAAVYARSERLLGSR